MGLPFSSSPAVTDPTSPNRGMMRSSVVVAVGSNCPTTPRAISTITSHIPMVTHGLRELMRARDSVIVTAPDGYLER